MREILQNARLVAFGFDNTAADTFDRSPNGIDVHIAYDRALETLFGETELLKVVGGLKNRAPTELVHDILRERPPLMLAGLRAYEAHRSRLSSQMPRGKGIPLSRIENGNHIDLFGELLVRLKLEILLAEIGPEWPLPCEGVLEFMAELRARDKHVAIISSGHDLFIRKCFSQWGSECPAIVLSDDDLRPQPGPMTQKMKPSKLLINYVIMMAHTRGISVSSADIVYFGDDLNKDGGLARNASIPFGWYCPAGLPREKVSEPFEFVFSCWKELRATLQ